MNNTLKKLQNRLEVLKAEKKGAASIETIIIAGLLIAVTVAVGTMLVTSINTASTASDTAMDAAGVTANTATDTSLYGDKTPN